MTEIPDTEIDNIKLDCEQTAEKVRKCINKLIEEHKKYEKWPNERYVHYKFFELLFDFFSPDEIKRNFVWEYPVGTPLYGKGNKSAALDLGMLCHKEKLIAIEIEYVSVSNLKEELEKCIMKLQSAPICKEQMYQGYIVPLPPIQYKDKMARGYGMSYGDLCRAILNDVEKQIKDPRIKLIREGVVLK